MARRIRGFLRTIRAMFVLGPLIFTYMRDARRFVLFGRPRQLSEEQHRSRAHRLTYCFESMGVTYIKLAQFLTTRPDMVPPIYVEEFEKLQDDVAPESFAAVKRVIEEDLGPIDEVFDYFEEEAISGASIAQVHKAGVDGEEVAVKVRRPGVEKRMEADLWVLSLIVPLFIRFLKAQGHKSHANSMDGITKELERTLHEEMDFNRERGVMEEIREKFAADGIDEDVIVPRPFPEYCTGRVLTMSYEDGVKIKHVDEVAELGVDLEEIVDTIAEAYLRMAFLYQVYQADPHHGNLAVNEDGKAIIYDFGISERPKDHLVDAFVRFFTGLGMQNADIALDALMEMGAIDRSMNRQTLNYVIEILIKDISGDNVTDTDIQELEQRVDQTLYDYPLTLHQDIVLAMRTTFGVEGLTAKVVPGYDFSEKLASFFIEEGLFEVDVDTDVDRDLEGFRLEGIKQELEDEIQKNGKRTVRSVVGGTLVVSGAIGLAAGLYWPIPAGVDRPRGISLWRVRRSLKSKDSVAGPPAIATRYNMDQWDGEEPEDGEPEGAVPSQLTEPPSQ
ncbi:MAG: AarF/UbiB family protein [Natrialbaceae archaeon]|nr:AarF/UbiB family protein [Natrialbaceae archaeon]